MNTFNELCEGITAYERKQLADDWSICFNETWKDVTFAEIISDIEKYGVGDRPFSTMEEIIDRVVEYFTFAFGEAPDDFDEKFERERLRKTSDAFKVLDEHLHLGLHDLVFKGQTADEIVDEWAENEKWEREEEERQACIDFCANFIYSDGLVDTLDEAYDLAYTAIR